MPHDELTNDGGTKPDGVFTTLALLPNGESRSLQAPAGWRLMEVLRDYGLPIRAECGGAALAIRFDTFSDGRGFTAARHIRAVLAYEGPLVAQGHIIPDQADYLRRCGFTHAEISLSAAAQWRRARALAPPAMQRVLDSPRARSLIPNRRVRSPRRRDHQPD